MEYALQGRLSYPIRTLAEQITRRIAPRDQLSEVLAVYHWVLRNTRYLNDPHGVELVRDPTAFLESMVGDCDDQGVLIGALCLCLGREIRYVTGGFKGPGHSHVWCEVLVGARRVALDPVAGMKTRKMLGSVRSHSAFY